MTQFNALEIDEINLARKIIWLCKCDYVFFSSYNEERKNWDDGAYPFVNCNDLFVPGADGESLGLDDIDDFINVVKKFPRAGDAAWCAAKRSAKLWRQSGGKEWQEEYDKAVKYAEKILSKK